MVTKDGIDIESALDMDEAAEADVVARAKELGADYVTVDAHGMAGYFKKGRKFERIRRITGYLVGTLDRWNSAKKAEEHDRVKHLESARET